MLLTMSPAVSLPALSPPLPLALLLSHTPSLPHFRTPSLPALSLSLLGISLSLCLSLSLSLYQSLPL